MPIITIRDADHPPLLSIATVCDADRPPPLSITTIRDADCPPSSTITSCDLLRRPSLLIVHSLSVTQIHRSQIYLCMFMVLTRLPYDPCVLYTLSCRDGSWIKTANHLSQIPLLLESEDVKDVNQILSVLFMSVSTNFSVFIRQVAEAQGKGGHVHSSKRKRKRLTTQDQLLMQLRETELHKRVSKCMDFMNSDSGFVTSSGNQQALLEIAANVASDGVKHSTLNPGSSGRLYSTDSAGSSKGNYESVSVEMSEPVTCSREQGPGKMIQTIDPSLSGCSVNNGHLIGNDALTMLLLVLPSHMWSGIKEPNLSAEFNSLVSIESVPHILKKESSNFCSWPTHAELASTARVYYDGYWFKCCT